MAKSILAVDIGSETITAAVCDGDNDPLALQPDGVAVSWPATVAVDSRGELTAVGDEGIVEIPRICRYLGRQAEVIGGAPRHADSLITVALSPIIASASEILGNRPPDLIAATYPLTWPQHIVGAFRNAVQAGAKGSEVVLVPWSEAIAAQTYAPTPWVDCPITSLDFGARSASVSLIHVDQRGRTKLLYSTTDPLGGYRVAGRAAVGPAAQSARQNSYLSQR